MKARNVPWCLVAFDRQCAIQILNCTTQFVRRLLLRATCSPGLDGVMSCNFFQEITQQLSMLRSRTFIDPQAHPITVDRQSRDWKSRIWIAISSSICSKQQCAEDWRQMYLSVAFSAAGLIRLLSPCLPPSRFRDCIPSACECLTFDMTSRLLLNV